MSHHDKYLDILLYMHISDPVWDSCGCVKGGLAGLYEFQYSRITPPILMP